MLRNPTFESVLDTISLSGNSEVLADALRGMLTAWLDAFTRIARESGLSARLASRGIARAGPNVEGQTTLPEGNLALA